MKRPFIIESLILLLSATFALWGCSRTNEADVALDRADAVIEEHPDSAMAIIDAIDTLQLTSAERRARYALLKSMALDKNYIDLTNMDVLQPAIDYYIDREKALLPTVCAYTIIRGAYTLMLASWTKPCGHSCLDWTRLKTRMMISPWDYCASCWGILTSISNNWTMPGNISPPLPTFSMG